MIEVSTAVVIPPLTSVIAAPVTAIIVVVAMAPLAAKQPLRWFFEE